MKIKITGNRGYLGKLISKRLTTNHEVTGIKRELLYGSVENLMNEIRGCDVIINLAGAPILTRWTAKNRKLIYDSRIKTSNNIVTAINKLPLEKRPKKFIAVSAIGIYKPGALHTEKSKDFDHGFVGKVVVDWEKALINLPSSIQHTKFRIGLVLGKEAKTITKLLLPFKLGLGGKIGSGKQPFPFIHEKDLVNAFVWALDNSEISNTFNLVAPEQINNKQFTAEMGKQLQRPTFFTVPAFMLKLIFGKAAILLTESPQVSSNKISKAGFTFEYPSIKAALQEILS